MPVAFDACTNVAGNGTSLSVSHTCTGSDRVLYVFVAIDAASDFNPAVTYNSVSLTQLAEVITQRYIVVFRLVAPAAGANTVSITGLPGGGRQHAFAISFAGVDQTTPNDAEQTISDTIANPSQTVASATGDMVCASLATNQGTAPTSNQTIPTNGSIADAGMSGAVAHAAGAASVAMNWTSAAASHSGIALNINAAAAGGTTGTLNETLDAATAAGAGSVAITGEGGATLADATLEAADVAPHAAARGGDDAPRYVGRKHRGWDQRRAQLKLKRERELTDSVAAIYRELTAEPSTRERAQQLIAPRPVARDDETRAQYAARLAERDSALRAERLRQLDAETEIALRLLHRELLELQQAQDEQAIGLLLAQVL